MKGTNRIRRSVTSLVLSLLMTAQSILPSYAAADEIHLINDLGSKGKGDELTPEEEAERNWGADLVSVAKSAWYDAHCNDEEDADAEMQKATPASLATASDLANVFEDFDELKARKDVEKLLKKADKEVISQSGTWLSHMLKEAVIPKEAVPRESVLKTEILELYKLNGDDYTVFHTEENWIPQVGDVVLFAKTVEKIATGSNIVATFSDFPEELTEGPRLKRRAARAVIGGVIIDAPDQNSERDKYITFLYCSEKDKIEIGYIPLEKAEIIGIASIQTLHDKYCGILEDAEEEPEQEDQVVEEEIVKNYSAFAHEQTIWGYRIALSADEGVFPEGTAVSIKPVTSIDGKNIEELLKKQNNKDTITKVMSFDITFTCDGQEIQPEDGTVSVSIQLASDMLKEKRKSDKNEVVVYHIPDADTVDEVASHLNEHNEVEYEAENFSVYSVAVKMAATEDVVASGYCGKNGGTNLSWTITGEEGNYTLTISGEGEMEDYASVDAQPWKEYRSDLVKLVLGNGITTIGDLAFFDCKGLICSLTIPDSVTSIGDNTFSYCRFRGSLMIPDSVTSIGAGAFSNCSGFTGSLTIPGRMSSIGRNAFCNCSGFTGSLTIPSSVTSIKYGAFDGCSGFTGSLTIPSSVTSIDQYAFKNCSGFTGSLTIPGGVTSLGYAAFEGCTGFTGNLTIPNSVTSINAAFYNCSGFTGNLTIPDGVTSISAYAFYNCSGFTGS